MVGAGFLGSSNPSLSATGPRLSSAGWRAINRKKCFILQRRTKAIALLDDPHQISGRGRQLLEPRCDSGDLCNRAACPANCANNQYLIESPIPAQHTTLCNEPFNIFNNRCHCTIQFAVGIYAGKKFWRTFTIWATSTRWRHGGGKTWGRNRVVLGFGMSSWSKSVWYHHISHLTLHRHTDKIRDICVIDNNNIQELWMPSAMSSSFQQWITRKSDRKDVDCSRAVLLQCWSVEMLMRIRLLYFPQIPAHDAPRTNASCQRYFAVVFTIFWYKSY